VLEKTTLERLRISSLGVEFCTDRLIALFENTRINAYVHLSIQSGSSSILRSMNRHYDGEKVREVLSKFRNIKREDGVMLNIGADIIVGFPGETEADYLASENLVHTYGITQLHAFAFSPHIDHYNVPAGSYLDQVPNHTAQLRLKKLLAAGKEAFEDFSTKNTNTSVRVLVEKVTG
jgi:tRNA A37 methylthiotransferase MiaB